MSSRPAIPAEISREILIESGHRCAVCGSPCPLERAHIIPWCVSREHKAEDLICLCANCHGRADKEKWGEKSLREYKRRPWVMRKYDNVDPPPGPTTQIELTVRIKIEQFDEKNQRWLQQALAAFVNRSPNDVQITSAEEINSIKVIIELPTQSAELLLSAHGSKDPELAKFVHPLVVVDVQQVHLESEESRKMLLETIVQLHRVANDPQVKQRINDELTDKENHTHSFSFREFLRTLIKDLAYVHKIIEKTIEEIDEETDGRTILRAWDHSLAQGRGNFSDRSTRRGRLVTEAILGAFPENQIPHLKLLRFLEMTAQQWIEDFFEVPTPNGGTLYLEGERFLTELDDSPDELKQWVQNHHPIPSPPPFPSGAAEFLHNHRNQVRAVEEVTRDSREPEEQDKSLLVLLDQLKDDDGEYDFRGKLKQNTRGNWVLGDLLIALETPSDMEIYTTDKHYNVLCRALAKRRYQGYQP